MEQLVLDALTRVLGRSVDARPDTPLDAFGLEPQAWPPLAAALRPIAVIADADVAGCRTLGDLVALVAQRAVGAP